MWWLLAVGVLVLLAVVVGARRDRRPRSTTTNTPNPAPAHPARHDRSMADDLAEIMAEQKIEAAKIEAEIMREVEAAMREAERDDDLEPDDPAPPVIWRSDYVAKDDEARYMTRGADGRPSLSLAHAGDRLAIWSSLDGGAIINPKGPGLRSLGLYCTSARGSGHYASAFRAADLRPGQWVDLKREPDNPHDGNAIAMCARGSRVPFAYVQRGRSPAVAKRIDKGEDMAAVSLRGLGPGDSEGVTLILIGSRTDIVAMLA